MVGDVAPAFFFLTGGRRESTVRCGGFEWVCSLMGFALLAGFCFDVVV